MSYQKNWCFTINNYELHEINRLHALEESNLITYIVYQTEMGENETPHIQGYVQLRKKARLSGVKKIIGKRGHFEPAAGSPLQNREYCTKEKGRIEGPYEYGEISFPGKRNDIVELREMIKENPNVEMIELLESHPNEVAKYPQFIKTCRTTYSKPTANPFVPYPGWQTELCRALDAEPHPRKIKWYFDEIGNHGKSYFGINYRSRIGRNGFLVNGGKHSDIIYAYENQNIIFFDLCRDSEERAPYALMESFKNGYLFSSKYNSQAIYFKTPHVVVFSNFYPDKTKLSEDRWEIIEL